MDFFETENAQFSSELEKIKTSDRVHADVYNSRFEKLVQNDVYLNSEINKVGSQLNNVESSLNNLFDVAKESSPKNIENKVTDINNRILTTATQTSVNSMQNTVNTMNSTISNINSVVNSINSKSNIKSVQRGVATLALNSNYVTNTISLSSINSNKCMVILNGQTNGITSGGQILNFEPYVESLSSSQLRIAYRNSDRHSGGTIYLYTSWQVIEFY